MKTLILQSKTLGFIVCKAELSDDRYYIENPRSLQAFPVPKIATDPVTKKQVEVGMELSVNLVPLVYVNLLKTNIFKSTISSTEYIDVTDQFEQGIIDMYDSAEERARQASSSADELYENDDDIIQFKK